MKIFKFIFYFLFNYCTAFIIPNELPTILSVIYSNIPPLKIGFDTRLGLGFRLGPHADYQTLIEIGPQTNTNPLSSNGTIAKRQSFPFGRIQRLYSEALKRTATVDKESQRKKTSGQEKKQQKTVVGNIEFKKVPGIDEVIRKTKPKNLKQEKTTAKEPLESPTKFSLL